jgi:predicted MFS family arabinose efflux permease
MTRSPPSEPRARFPATDAYHDGFYVYDLRTTSDFIRRVPANSFVPSMGFSWSVRATNRTGTKVQGAFLGLYNSMYFLGGTVGPILLGLFVDLTGYQALYTSTLLIYAIGVLLTLSISRSKSSMNF